MSLRPLGLYIHWPFCVSKCPYCDFNSHVREQVDYKRWQKALLQELEVSASQASQYQLVSIFFGGGTPSLMAPETVASLIQRARQLWPIKDDLEITLEANPGTIDTARFQEFRGAGINRLSLGIQALNDQALGFLGRKHDAAQALKAIQLAKENFPRYSFDLIYARPHQTVLEWAAELKEALNYAGDHLSLYQLTIEQGTAFHGQYQRGEFKIPGETLAAQLYQKTEETMEKAGLPAYEVSNYAKPENECRHNLVYWRYEDYIGIGPGAHGRITQKGQKLMTQRIRAPELWLEAVEKAGQGLKSQEALSPQERLYEQMLMGLRLVEGISEQRLYQETGVNFEQVLNKASLIKAEQEGLVLKVGNHLKATLKGRLCLNSLTAYLLR